MMLLVNFKMLSSKSREELVKASIPRQLQMAIIKIQAAEGLDWEPACKRASEIMHANDAVFKKAVAREAERRFKSRFTTQMNTARNTIWNDAYREGEERVRANEDNFHVSCAICGKPMTFSSRDNNWEEEKKILYQAFSSWHHSACKQAT
jgi:hypothetical protein